METERQLTMSPFREVMPPGWLRWVGELPPPGRHRCLSDFACGCPGPRRDGLRLAEAADALKDLAGPRFVRLGRYGPEPVPEVARLLAEMGGRDVVYDHGDRRRRWRDNRDVC